MRATEASRAAAAIPSAAAARRVTACASSAIPRSTAAPMEEDPWLGSCGSCGYIYIYICVCVCVHVLCVHVCVCCRFSARVSSPPPLSFSSVTRTHIRTHPPPLLPPQQGLHLPTARLEAARLPCPPQKLRLGLGHGLFFFGLVGWLVDGTGNTVCVYMTTPTLSPSPSPSPRLPSFSYLPPRPLLGMAPVVRALPANRLLLLPQKLGLMGGI